MIREHFSGYYNTHRRILATSFALELVVSRVQICGLLKKGRYWLWKLWAKPDNHLTH